MYMYTNLLLLFLMVNYTSIGNIRKKKNGARAHRSEATNRQVAVAPNRQVAVAPAALATLKGM